MTILNETNLPNKNRCGYPIPVKLCASQYLNPHPNSGLDAHPNIRLDEGELFLVNPQKVAIVTKSKLIKLCFF